MTGKPVHNFIDEETANASSAIMDKLCADCCGMCGPPDEALIPKLNRVYEKFFEIGLQLDVAAMRLEHAQND